MLRLLLPTKRPFFSFKMRSYAFKNRLPRLLERNVAPEPQLLKGGLISLGDGRLPELTRSQCCFPCSVSAFCVDGCRGRSQVHEECPGLRSARLAQTVVLGILVFHFGKMLLVFGCIGSDFCKKIRVLKHFSKSTRLSS